MPIDIKVVTKEELEEIVNEKGHQYFVLKSLHYTKKYEKQPKLKSSCYYIENTGELDYEGSEPPEYEHTGPHSWREVVLALKSLKDIHEIKEVYTLHPGYEYNEDWNEEPGECVSCEDISHIDRTEGLQSKDVEKLKDVVNREYNEILARQLCLNL